MLDDLLTYPDAARILGLPVGTLYSLVSRRDVPHVRLGPRTVRFERAARQTWIDARRVALKEGGAR